MSALRNPSIGGIALSALLAINLNGCSGSAETPVASTSAPDECSGLGRYVSVGGTAGFNTLVNRDFTVDDYENVDPNDAKAMGPDTAVNTTTQVALWLATHAPVYAHGKVCRPLQ